MTFIKGVDDYYSDCILCDVEIHDKINDCDICLKCWNQEEEKKIFGNYVKI